MAHANGISLCDDLHKCIIHYGIVVEFMNTTNGMSAALQHEFDESSQRSPLALQVLDTELRLMWSNTAARAIHAFRSDAQGHRIREWAGAFYSQQLKAMLRGVLASGVPKIDVQLRGRTDADSREVVVSASWFRLTDASGRVLGLVAQLVDVTARDRARAARDLLRRAHARVGTTLDIFSTAQEFADTMVPDLADTVVVDLLDSVLRGEAPPAGAPLGEHLVRCVGHQSVAHGTVAVGEATRLTSSSPYAQDLADLQPRLVPRPEADPGRLEHVPSAGPALGADAHSLMVVPLTARGVTLGMARFYRSNNPEPFDHEDLELAADLVGHTALCLDNARLYTRERSIVRLLQLGLQPAEVPAHAAAEIARSYRPAGSGADWFDVIPLPSSRIAFVVGSTAGRGIRAAAAIGEMRAAISALATLDLLPDELLERLYALAVRFDEDQPSRPEDEVGDYLSGATCLYVIYDPVSRQCSLASAGHPPPVLAHPDGRVAFADMPVGSPLGRGTARYRATEIELPEGCIISLFNTTVPASEGIEPEEQLSRITAALQPRSRPLKELCEAVLSALTPDRPTNDAALLMARTRVLGSDQVASWPLPNDPAAVAEARAHVERQLTAWELGDLMFTAVLVASELVTNAVRYSADPIRLRLIRNQSLVCEVTDGSTAAPSLRHAEEEDEGGRGLYIVAQFTTRWGIRPERHGKTIWAELETPEAAGEEGPQGSGIAREDGGDNDTALRDQRQRVSEQ